MDKGSKNKPINRALDTLASRSNCWKKHKNISRNTSPKKNRTRIYILCVIRSNIFYLQLVLIKQPGATICKKRGKQHLRKASYFALWKQINVYRLKNVSCHRNEHILRHMSNETESCQPDMPIRYGFMIGSSKTKPNCQWTEVIAQFSRRSWGGTRDKPKNVCVGGYRILDHWSWYRSPQRNAP